MRTWARGVVSMTDTSFGRGCEVVQSGATEGKRMSGVGREYGVQVLRQPVHARA